MSQNHKCCSHCHVETKEEHKHEHEDHHHEHSDIKPRDIAMFGIGVAFFIAALFAKDGAAYALLLYLTAYFLIGWEILLSALKNISKGKAFDENFLMSLATIGAFAIGEYPEGVAVMLFFRIGEFFQDIALARSRSSIAALMNIRPDYANLITSSGHTRVNPQDVAVGDKILVKPGEKIPLDGVVIEGKSTLDVSALTGESLPKEAFYGCEVLSGSLNQAGTLKIEASKVFGESTVSKILELTQNASAKKAPTENFITKFAKYYTPFVVFCAAALAFLPPLFGSAITLEESFSRALVFLVVSCPCALVVSIPLSFFGGIGGASRNGILIKGGNFLEALKSADTVVFDKTGTLTKGVFGISRISAADGFGEDETLKYAAYAEHYSNHPIALSIKKAYKEAVDEAHIASHEELAGYGVKAVIGSKKVVVGTAKLMEQEGVALTPKKEFEGAAYVAIDGKLAGYITIEDEIKEDAKQGIEELKRLGITNIAMLTGDSEGAARRVADKLGIKTVYAGLLPHQKVEKLEEIISAKKQNGKTIFVGDGINDAPSLARADIGIAMGGVGSDAAIEAADVVLMTDEVSKIATALKIAKKTNVIVWQNIAFALGVKGAILVMGAFGVATMWEAVFGDVGVAIIAILNAARVLRH